MNKKLLQRMEIFFVRNVMDIAGKYGVSTKDLDAKVLRIMCPQLARCINPNDYIWSIIKLYVWFIIIDDIVKY